MSDNKITKQLNEIDEIVVSNPIGDELSLEKVPNDKLEVKKTYKEVFVSDLSLMTGNVSQVALQVANHGMTLAQIANQAPNGLFTATVNPTNLSKFANGTTTTMVRDSSGHLVEHAGFANIGLTSSVNPAIILSAGMQAMSAVSGTYYLHEINAKFTDIDAKLEELLNIHHDTNIGRLIAANKRLSEFSARQFVDITDLNAIKDYKKTADEIHEEYIYRLKRKTSENKNLSDINFTIRIAFEANKLSLFAELIEIGLRMKIGSQFEIIKELTSQLKKNYFNSFYHNIESEVDNSYSILQQRSNKELLNQKKKFEKSLKKVTNNNSNGWAALSEIGIKAVFAGKAFRDVSKAEAQVMSEKKNLILVKKDLKHNKESDGIENIIDEVINLQHKETEILYIPTENNKPRVFMPI